MHQELVQKVVLEYRRLGFEIDLDRLNIAVVDERRAREDMAAIAQDLSVPGQTEGLSVIMRMAGRREGRDSRSLQELAVSHLSERTLAYYDARSHTLAFRDLPLARVLGLKPLVRHELGHAYQDQKLGGVAFAQRCEHPTLDSYKAAHLVTEGHAQLLASALQFAEQGLPLSRLDPNLVDDTGARLMSGEGLTSTYAAGFRYAVTIWNEGAGWHAVEESFSHPPSSTEQVLHPEKNGRDLPRDVSLPGLPAALRAGRTVIDTTVGELLVYLELLPESRSLDEAFLAAAGWDGDRLRVVQLPNGEYVAEWRLIWDRVTDAAQFVKLLGRWKAASPRTRVFVQGPLVDVVYAESEAAGAALRKSLAGSVPKVVPEAEDATSTAAVEARRIGTIQRRARLKAGRWVMPELGLSFAVPPSFQPKNINGTAVLFGETNSGFTENITVLSAPDLHAGDIEQHLREAKRQLAQTEQRLIGAETARVADCPVALFELELAAKGMPVRSKSATVLVNGRAVTVAYSARAADWPRKQQLIRELFASIRVDN
ncbi:MAG: hypothetical protein JW940_19500 [Polyangiaceae bacterium]|nr:hypothetical protein [Polyangiaceae bacterium]